jgi:hypothetical protein
MKPDKFAWIKSSVVAIEKTLFGRSKHGRCPHHRRVFAQSARLLLRDARRIDATPDVIDIVSELLQRIQCADIEDSKQPQMEFLMRQKKEGPNEKSEGQYIQA